MPSIRTRSASQDWLPPFPNGREWALGWMMGWGLPLLTRSGSRKSSLRHAGNRASRTSRTDSTCVPVGGPMAIAFAAI
jgi:hypothetical protein